MDTEFTSPVARLPDAVPPAGEVSYVKALVFSALLGYFGVDRFYLGYITSGIFKLLTLGGFGLWAAIDFTFILTGKLQGSGGRKFNDIAIYKPFFVRFTVISSVVLIAIFLFNFIFLASFLSANRDGFGQLFDKSTSQSILDGSLVPTADGTFVKTTPTPTPTQAPEPTNCGVVGASVAVTASGYVSDKKLTGENEQGVPTYSILVGYTLMDFFKITSSTKVFDSSCTPIDRNTVGNDDRAAVYAKVDSNGTPIGPKKTAAVIIVVPKQ